jgi:hypothetical protein
VFEDPALPASIRALEGAAHHAAYVRAAAHHFRAGRREEGNEAFLGAVRARPAFVVDARSLRRFCRVLLPGELQHEEVMATHWRTASASVRAVVHDLFARPDLEPEIAALRWRTHLAVLRFTARLARKKLLGGWRRPAAAVDAT